MIGNKNQTDDLTDDDLDTEDYYEEDGFEESSDEEFAQDGDWEDEEEYEYEDDIDTSSAPPAKKKSSMGTLLIIGAVVVAGGVGYMMMNGGASQKAPAPRPAAQQAQQQARPAPAGKAQQPGTAKPAANQAQDQSQQSGFLNDPNAFNVLGQQVEDQGSDDVGYVDEILPMPTKTAQKRAAQSSDLLTPLPQPAALENTVPAGTDSIGDALPAPAAATQKAQPRQQELTIKETAPAPTPVSATAPSDATLKALDKKLSMLVDRLDQVESKIEKLSAPTASASPDAVKKLQTSINTLEKRLDALARDQKTVSRQTTTAAAPKAAPKTTAPAVKDVMTPMPGMEKPAETKTATKASSGNANWVLKSALPGEAYVSQKGSSDMIRVKVGDTLPGLGRVTSIDNVGGTWIVEGEQGKITP